MRKRLNTNNKKINPTQYGNKRYNQKAEQSTGLSINSLPPEVLMHIFGYLSTRDRLRMEGVCKHWKIIVQKSWQTVQKLRISTSYLLGSKNQIQLTLNSEDSFTINTEDRQRVLKKILPNCGCFVKKVCLSGTVGLKTYSLVRDNCPNITKLRLNNFDAYADMKVLGPIFNRCKQLRKLKIDCCNSKVISVLKQLPIEKLENFVVKAMRSDCTASDMILFTEKLQSLKRFTFPIYPPLMRAVGMTMDLNFPFSLYADNRISNPRELFNMLDLTNLEYIYLPGLDTDDDFFIEMAVICKHLRHLHIGDSAPVTEKGLNAVSTLPKLNSLKVAGVDTVTDEILPRFNRLKRLHCGNCDALTRAGYMSLIKSSKKLEELCITYKEVETEEFLTAVAAYVDTRSPKKVLTIGVFWASDDLVTQFSNKSKYLDVYEEV